MATERKNEGKRGRTDQIFTETKARVTDRRLEERSGEGVKKRKTQWSDDTGSSTSATAADMHHSIRKAKITCSIKLKITTKGGLYQCLALGIKVWVPPDAVDADTEIQIAVRKDPLNIFDLPTEVIPRSDQIVITPHGLTYNKPIYIIFEHRVPAARLIDKNGKVTAVLLNRNTDQDNWEIVDSCQDLQAAAEIGHLKKSTGKAAWFTDRHCFLSMRSNCTECVVESPQWGRRRVMYAILHSERDTVSGDVDFRFYMIHGTRQRYQELLEAERGRGEFIDSRKVFLSEPEEGEESRDLTLHLSEGEGWSASPSSLTVPFSVLRGEWRGEGKEISPLAVFTLTPGHVSPTSVCARLVAIQSHNLDEPETMEPLYVAFDLSRLEKPMGELDTTDDDGGYFEAVGVDYEPQMHHVHPSCLLYQHLSLEDARRFATILYPGFDIANSQLHHDDHIVGAVVAELATTFADWTSDDILQHLQQQFQWTNDAFAERLRQAERQ